MMYNTIKQRIKKKYVLYDYFSEIIPLTKTLDTQIERLGEITNHQNP